jgi:hypothetical protein
LSHPAKINERIVKPHLPAARKKERIVKPQKTHRQAT